MVSRWEVWKSNKNRSKERRFWEKAKVWSGVTNQESWKHISKSMFLRQMVWKRTRNCSKKRSFETGRDEPGAWHQKPSKTWGKWGWARDRIRKVLKTEAKRKVLKQKETKQARRIKNHQKQGQKCQCPLGRFRKPSKTKGKCRFWAGGVIWDYAKMINNVELSAILKQAGGFRVDLEDYIGRYIYR